MSLKTAKFLNFNFDPSFIFKSESKDLGTLLFNILKIILETKFFI